MEKGIFKNLVLKKSTISRFQQIKLYGGTLQTEPVTDKCNANIPKE